ncbi:MAG: glycosyltransferase family 4 protein [Limnochordia bacterium]|jgi:UDP-GlcNAc:undecaprenyl-phosphate GlcNAc-1-phosphate transferase
MGYLGAFFTALVITFLITPLVRRLAVRYGFIDRPNERRVNRVPVPTGGGVGIFLGFTIPVLLTLPLSRTTAGILASGGLILLLGLIDDRWSLRPLIKLAGQIAVAYLLTRFGLRIEFVTNPFGDMLYLGPLATPVTILWIVAVTNTINLIDGLDGLAAGIASIACFPLFLIALQRGQTLAAFLTIALAGSCIGFLPHNFNPATIFMGDAGAMFLGFMLGAIAVQGALKGPTTIALTVPILILGVPIFDTLFAIVRRWQRGTPFYVADKGHVHHRLLDLGLTQRQAVMVMYFIGSFFGTIGLWLAGLETIASTLLFIFVGLGAALLARKLGVISSHRARGRFGG